MGITACTVPPGPERYPTGHICFHYTCNRLRRKRGRKQTQSPNGFIPLFPQAVIKTKSILQHTASAALYRVNTVFSYLLLRWRLIPRLTHALYSSLGTGRSLAPVLCGAQTFLCVASPSSPSNHTVLSVPTGLLATHKLPEGRNGAHQCSCTTERRKIISSKWVMNWSSGVWVTKRSRTEGVKGRKPPKVPKTIFALPTDLWWLVPQWPEKQTLIPYICVWTRRNRFMWNSDS